MTLLIEFHESNLNRTLSTRLKRERETERKNEKGREKREREEVRLTIEGQRLDWLKRNRLKVR